MLWTLHLSVSQRAVSGRCTHPLGPSIVPLAFTSISLTRCPIPSSSIQGSSLPPDTLDAVLWTLAATAQLQPQTPLQAFRGHQSARRRRELRGQDDAAAGVPGCYAAYARSLFDLPPNVPAGEDSDSRTAAVGAPSYRPPPTADSGVPQQGQRWFEREAVRRAHALLDNGMIEAGAATRALARSCAALGQEGALRQEEVLLGVAVPRTSRAVTPMTLPVTPCVTATPLRLLSEAGPAAHEALLAVVHAADVRIRGGEAASRPLPPGTPLVPATRACRDALCGVPSVLLPAAAASHGMCVALSARLSQTSLVASRGALQPFATAGTRLRRLTRVADGLLSAGSTSAAALAAGNALHSYLRAYRLQVTEGEARLWKEW